MLDNRNKKNPFVVPENYFQNFNAEIMNKLPENKPTENKKVIPLWKSAVSKWISTAAVISGVAFVGIHYMNNNTGNLISKSMTTQIAIENPIAFENEYHQFIEDEATRIAYKDAFYYDDL